MYLSTTERKMLETTLYNLRYDMDCIGQSAEIWAELSAMTDAELENVLNCFLADL